MICIFSPASAVVYRLRTARAKFCLCWKTQQMMNSSVKCLIFIMQHKCEQKEKRDCWLYSPRIWSDFKRLWQCESVNTLALRQDVEGGGPCLLIWAARASISQGSVESRCCGDARLDVIHVRHLLMKFCLQQSGNEERWNASLTAQKHCIMSVVYPRGVRREWCDWDLSP